MTDSVVVDASLAVKWVALEDYSAEALALLAEWEAAGTERLVPLWFVAEVSNVLYRQARAIGAPLSDVAGNLHDVSVPVTLREIALPTVVRAVEIAYQLNHSRTYDAVYAALAEREGCELWTADERFWRIASPRFAFVRWIGERAGMT
jgi:predicted nucleic acid-binding protein